MTIEELSEYYRYSVEIKALDDELRYIRGKQGEAETIAKLEKLKALCEVQRARISDYIFSVNDPLVVGMLYARFILCKSWYGVAMYVGGNNTADSCRMTVFRHIKK